MKTKLMLRLAIAAAALVALIAALATLLTLWGLRPQRGAPTAAMVGHWEGNARIVVSWCQQTNLPVKVDLRADGTVTGAVGDATLARGHFKPNGSWLGRKLHLFTDYVIGGGLDGPIVAAEGIKRAQVVIPLNFRGGAFTGGVNTDGTFCLGKPKEYMKDNMALTAGDLVLTRSR